MLSHSITTMSIMMGTSLTILQREPAYWMIQFFAFHSVMVPAFILHLILSTGASLMTQGMKVIATGLPWLIHPSTYAKHLIQHMCAWSPSEASALLLSHLTYDPYGCAYSISTHSNNIQSLPASLMVLNSYMLYPCVAGWLLRQGHLRASWLLYIHRQLF